MDFTEKTVKEEYLYKGKILNLRRDEVELPNKEKAFREVVEHSGGSCVLCEDNDKVVLVKQFRYPYKEEMWEIPAGKLNNGEDPQKTAVRELEEECGLVATDIKKIFEIYPTPGYSAEKIHIYFVKEFKKTSQHLDEDEFLSVKWFTYDEIKCMIENGKIKDGKTLIALLNRIRELEI